MYTYDENTFHVMYKETWGYSPYSDHLFYKPGTCRNQKQVMWDALEDAHTAASEHFRRNEYEAIEEYEQEIASWVAAGAVSRTMAIYWIAHMYEIEDPDELVWTLGLPQDFRKEIIRAMESTGQGVDGGTA
jgi:hypothetical protein